MVVALVAGAAVRRQVPRLHVLQRAVHDARHRGGVRGPAAERVIAFALGVAESFVGGMLALAIWVHWDLEGWWEQRRLRHGKTLDQRQRRAADRH